MSASTDTPTCTSVDSRTRVTFARRQGEPTTWIEIAHPVDAEPTALLDELAFAGFVPDGMRGFESDAIAWNFDVPVGHPDRMRHLGYTETEVVLVSRGSGLFSAWTRNEAVTKMRAARTALRKYGFTDVEVWDKSAADME